MTGLIDLPAAAILLLLNLPLSPEANAPPAEAPAATSAADTSHAPVKPYRGWNDQRRTIRGYPRNFGHNLLRVPTRANAIPFGVGASLTALSTGMDQRTITVFERTRFTDLADVGATAGGAAIATGLTVGLFSIGRVASGERFRAMSYDVGQAILVDTVYTFTMKTATRRRRPDGSNRASFPSGHASLAFGWATVIERHYGAKGGIPAYALAALIGGSRLAGKRHYLSDVMAGATLGFACGRTVVREDGRAIPIAKPPVKPVVGLWLDRGPQQDGAGLRVSVVF
jgi:membrane-associated phospholipid phosphatase